MIVVDRIADERMSTTTLDDSEYSFDNRSGEGINQPHSVEFVDCIEDFDTSINTENLVGSSARKEVFIKKNSVIFQKPQFKLCDLPKSIKCSIIRSRITIKNQTLSPGDLMITEVIWT